MAAVIITGEFDSEVARLGARVRDRRKILKLSQKALGVRCNLASSYISDVENGQVNPTFLSLLRLAEGLELDIGDLVKI